MTTSRDAAKKIVSALSADEDLMARMGKHLDMVELDEAKREVTLSWPGAFVVACLGTVVLLTMVPTLVTTTLGLEAGIVGMTIYGVMLRSLRIGDRRSAIPAEDRAEE